MHSDQSCEPLHLPDEADKIGTTSRRVGEPLDEPVEGGVAFVLSTPWGYSRRMSTFTVVGMTWQ